MLELSSGFADTVGMFLRSKTRKKDGKEHRYGSVVENRRVANGRVEQRQVLYLGEINDAQRAAGAVPLRSLTKLRALPPRWPCSLRTAWPRS